MRTARKVGTRVADAKLPLKIGLLIDRWDPSRGGAERALEQLADGLELRGHSVLAFAAEGPRAGAPADARWQRVRPGFALSRASHEKRLARALVEAARSAGCDVLIGVRHLYECDLWWPHGGCQRATLRALGKPLRGRHRLFVELEQRMAASARRIACVSRLVQREIELEHPLASAKCVLAGSAVDLERFHPRERAGRGEALRRELGLAPDECLIGFSARQPRTKGLPVLLEALRELRAGGARVRLLVNGARIRARAGVHVLPELDPAVFSAACDLLAHPTLRDTFGLVIAEALASGTPVVTSARAGAAELLQRPEHGIVLADPEDGAALLEALRSRLLMRPPRELVREAVRDCGREPWLGRMESICREAASDSGFAPASAEV
jgi:glycosyltransferase involved in cell wall biosynthesis